MVDNSWTTRSYLVKRYIYNLNKLCHVTAVPGKHPGAQCSFTELLEQHITDYLSAHPDHNPTEPLQIKISGDGARMSRNTNFNLLSFCLLQEKRAMSSKGNRTIAIVDGPESYNVIKESFKDCLFEINELIKRGKITIDGVDLPVEIFLGGDYKFLLIIMGLSGATSDYACLWCKVHRLSRWMTTEPLMKYNSEPRARTLSEIKKMASLPKSSKNKKFSCVHPPLLEISTDHIILDELHMMMRVTDRLTENLIKEVLERDSKRNFNLAKNDTKNIYRDTLLKAINETGAVFTMWEKMNADGRSSGSFDWTSLIGADKKKVMEGLPNKLEAQDILFPETKETVVKIWRDFTELYKEINQTDLNKDTFETIHMKAKLWIELFCSLGGTRQGYSKDRVTPYMHCLVYHIPYFIKLHGSFKKFTGQGVEKNNDDAKKAYFQKSNKWDAAKDILELESRQEHLKKHEREKRPYRKQNTNYWNNDITEIRKKRHKASRDEGASNQT